MNYILPVFKFVISFSYYSSEINENRCSVGHEFQVRIYFDENILSSKLVRDLIPGDDNFSSNLKLVNSFNRLQ